MCQPFRVFVQAVDKRKDTEDTTPWTIDSITKNVLRTVWNCFLIAVDVMVDAVSGTLFGIAILHRCSEYTLDSRISRARRV